MTAPSPISIIAKRFLSGFPEINFFEIGLRLAKEYSGEIDDQMKIRTIRRSALIESTKYLRYLQAMNFKGYHIYIRPVFPHRYTLIDDLTLITKSKLISQGLEPCAVVETSPFNYQIWLRNNLILCKELSTLVAQILAKKTDGDMSSADYRHFGRFPGFTNTKKKYLINNVRPFSKLISVSNISYSQSTQIIDDAKIIQAKNKISQLKKRTTMKPNVATKDWDFFYSSAKYSGDLNRIDLAYCVHALFQGESTQTIHSVIASRDLTHKGSAARQQAYLDRTINKAILYTNLKLSSS